jgi:exonuclease VII large subunit
VLARGYSLTLNARGEIVRTPAMVAVGESIVTRLARGELESDVTKKR